MQIIKGELEREKERFSFSKFLNISASLGSDNVWWSGIVYIWCHYWNLMRMVDVKQIGSHLPTFPAEKMSCFWVLKSLEGEYLSK